MPKAIASAQRRLKTLPGLLFSFSLAITLSVLLTSTIDAGLDPVFECKEPCAVAEDFEGCGGPCRQDTAEEASVGVTPDGLPAPAAPEGARAEAPVLNEGTKKPLPLPSPPDITRGPIERMELAITFDGGGFEGEEASTILDTLKEKGIRTTIFITGTFIMNYPEVTKRIVEDGHEVGNHTMTHPRLTDYATTLRQRTLPWVTRSFIEKELKGTAELFKSVTGAEMAPLWRAPYGEINDEIRRWAFESGYVHIGWTSDYSKRESLDTLDWVDDRTSRLYRTSYQIKERILGFGRAGSGIRGGIILMHLGTGRKSDRASGVLGEMIDAIEEKGYRFVKVSTLIEGNPAYAFLLSKRSEKVLKGMVRLERGEHPTIKD